MPSSASRPRRTHAQARADMRAAILERGNEQLAQVGAAGLSVREIARDIGVASSALYRHVANRDALLTLLLVDAYADLADAVLAAVARVESAPDQVAALAHALRAWAVAHPARWALVYGSPVPGYQAPAQETTEPGTRVMGAFVAALAALPGAHAGAAPAPSSGLAALLSAEVVERELAATPALATDAVVAWTGLIGVVSAEIFGHLGPEVAAHGAELLDRWVATTLAQFAD